MNLAQQDALIDFARAVRETDHIVIDGGSRVLVSRNHLRVRVHRMLYRQVVGDLGNHEFLLQTCDAADCVNPWHYEKAKRSWTEVTHCRNGHEYGPEDVRPNGYRRCSTCHEALKARRRKGGLRQWEIQKERQFCPYGHPYVPDNTYLSSTSSGGVRRKCKTCTRARNHGLDPADVSWP